MSTPHRVTSAFWDHATIWSDDESLAGHSTDGGRVFGITRTRYAECARYGCRPVAVVDPSDREQIDRLCAAFSRAEILSEGWDDGPRRRRCADALREFADPKPPRPAEPTGLGAVVVDRDGSALVRVDGDSSHPWRATGGHRFSWDDVDHLTTLSEGAEPMADWEIDLLRGAR